MTRRNYEAITSEVAPLKAQEATLRQLIDALWNGLHDAGVSWVPGGGVGDRLVV